MAALEPPSTRPCAVCAQAFTSEGFSKSQWKKGDTAKCLACAQASCEAENAGTAPQPEPKAALPEPKMASAGPARGVLLGEVQALVPAMFLRSPPPGGKRTSLEKHHGTFMSHGVAWLVMIDTYMQAVSGNSKALATLEKMATSTSKGPGGRGEACFTKYLCGLVFLWPEAMGKLRLRTDKEKGTRYWIAAAKTGNPQPSTQDTKPLNLDLEPYTLNPKPKTQNPKDSTLHPNPSNLNPQPSTPNPKP